MPIGFFLMMVLMIQMMFGWNQRLIQITVLMVMLLNHSVQSMMDVGLCVAHCRLIFSNSNKNTKLDKCNVKAFNKSPKPLSLEDMQSRFSGCISAQERRDIKENELDWFYLVNEDYRSFNRAQNGRVGCGGIFGRCFIGDYEGDRKSQDELMNIAGYYRVRSVIKFRYRVSGHLGIGGNAMVVSAIDGSNGMQVALKIAYMEPFFASKQKLSNPQSKVNVALTNEIKVNYMMQNHQSSGLKYINPVLDDFQWNGQVVAVFPKLHSFKSVIKRATYNDLIRWTQQILLAMKHLMMDQYLHNDIKPDNILFKLDNGRYDAVLNDFALCKEVGSTGRVGTKLFVPTHCSQWAETQLMLNDDMFSLGLTVLNFVFGTHYLKNQKRLMIRDDDSDGFWRTLIMIKDCLSGAVQDSPTTSNYDDDQDDPERYGIKSQKLSSESINLHHNHGSTSGGSSVKSSNLKCIFKRSPRIAIPNDETLDQVAQFIALTLFENSKRRISIDDALKMPLFQQIQKVREGQ
ncbi:hypothetical protein MIR68_000606 [Amoeboaphelidium protococcarum]|nr:hypothetical protein MIR68_000606 [Amoeboaphelidium protococcarum]